MMKKMMNWVLAATLFCGTMAFMTGCKEAKAQESDSKPKVVSTELIRTSQSWDGVELPDYFQGRPELVAVKYVRAGTAWSCLTTSRDAPNWWL